MKWLFLLMSSLIYLGSGNGNSTQSQQFFDRLLTPPTGAREALYASLIDGLYVDGTWAKLDGLYVFAAADEATALTNLLSNNYRANYTSDPPDYLADRYLSPQSGTTPITYNFNPATAGGHYAQNDACLFGWNLYATSLSGWLLGTSTSVIELVPKDATSHTLLAINSNSKDDYGTGVTSDATGCFVANRTSASAVTLDRNGTQIATSSTVSTTPESLSLTSTAITQISVIGFGSSLTSTQRTNLYVRLQSYLLEVGAI